MKTTDDNLKKLLEITQQLQIDMTLSKTKLDTMNTKLDKVEKDVEDFKKRVGSIESYSWFGSWVNKIRDKALIGIMLTFMVGLLILLIIHMGDELFQKCLKLVIS